MKKQLLISTMMLLLASSHAYAADAPAASTPATPAPAADTPAPKETGEKHHGMTLDEARKRAHERAEKLDKMTEDEWAEKQKKHHEWMDKWHSMTPEEKDAYKKMKQAKRHHKEQDESAAPAVRQPATLAPPTDKQ